MYVDAIRSITSGVIRVVERIDGERVYKDFEDDLHFYIDDPTGAHTTMYGTSVRRIEPTCPSEKKKFALQYSSTAWESDVSPIFRCLENEYSARDTPSLHIAFFDIETDFDKERGYSSPEEAFTEITSIAVYLQWIDTMVCLAVPPKTLSWEKASVIATEVGSEVMLFTNEKEMLKAFLDLIEDADVLSGWNSEMYDIPFTINRVIHTLGKIETRKFCLWGKAPRSRKIERGGKEHLAFELVGRVHLDYMQLYKKYNYEERHSYALNAIAEQELGQQKVEYKGTLDQLYNNDFKKFLEYNIQDTALLDQLDKKLQFIDLCNAIAHDNCVLLPTTMGSVAMIDHAIAIEAHSKNLVVKNKKRFQSAETRAAGGWVATPNKGLHHWVGSADLNSLYSSVIRALNMSPETIVGQIDLRGTNQTICEYENETATQTFATWWNDRFCPLEMEMFFENNNYVKLTLKMEEGTSYTVTGAELRRLIFESGQPWCISANGTIFRTDVEGIIPSLLSKWYTERKQLQELMYIYNQISDNKQTEGFHIPAALFTVNDVDENVHHANPFDRDQAFKPSKLEKLIQNGYKNRIVEYMNLHQLTVKNNKVVFIDQVKLKSIVSFWDKRQLIKKILLNSAYGALLNAGSRFFDQRIGQSTTLTGRNITKHMAAKTNEYITGIYDHYGESIIYGDSITGDSIIKSSIGDITIKELYDTIGTTCSTNNGKEYAEDSTGVSVLGMNAYDEKIVRGNINHVMRHKTKKKLYKIETDAGKYITVTEDHSLIVDRNGVLLDITPLELKNDDLLVTL